MQVMTKMATALMAARERTTRMKIDVLYLTLSSTCMSVVHAQIKHVYHGATDLVPVP